MIYASNITTGCFGICILLLMLFNFGSKSSRKREFDDHLFTCMIITNILLLTMDILTWMVDGKPGAGTSLLNRLFNSLYYCFQPIMCQLWVLYCDYKLNENISRLKKRFIPYILPIFIAFALILANCLQPFIFTFSPGNVYMRLDGYFIFLLICLLPLLFTTVMTLHAISSDPGRAGKGNEPRYYLLLYPAVPVIAVIAQSLFYGIAIIWTASVVSLLIIYFNLQNARITTDPLTGINNRYRFDAFMHSRMRNRQIGSMMFVLMIDIDCFKTINDRLGHVVGDDAIRETALLLERSIRKADFIARIGGDEFVVVGECPTQQDVTGIIAAIRREIDLFNKAGTHPYPLSLSIGLSLLAESEDKSVDELISEADRSMYSQKRMHHLENF